MKAENLILTIVIAFLLVFLISGLFGGMMDYNKYGYGMMGNLFGGFGFMWIFGSLFMVLVLIALVLLIAWLIKQLQNHESPKIGKRK